MEPRGEELPRTALITGLPLKAHQLLVQLADHQSICDSELALKVSLSCGQLCKGNAFNG